jgi:hypothetical protein
VSAICPNPNADASCQHRPKSALRDRSKIGRKRISRRNLGLGGEAVMLVKLSPRPVQGGIDPVAPRSSWRIDLQVSPAAWRDAFPLPKSTMEGIRVLVAQKIGHLIDAHVWNRQELVGEFLSRLHEE